MTTRGRSANVSQVQREDEATTAAYVSQEIRQEERGSYELEPEARPQQHHLAICNDRRSGLAAWQLAARSNRSNWMWILLHLQQSSALGAEGGRWLPPLGLHN